MNCTFQIGRKFLSGRFLSKTWWWYASFFLTTWWVGQKIWNRGSSFDVWQVHISCFWYTMSSSQMPVQWFFCPKCSFTIVAFINQFMKLDAMQSLFPLWIENLVTYFANDNYFVVYSFKVSFETLLVEKSDLTYLAIHLIFFRLKPQLIGSW